MRAAPVSRWKACSPGWAGIVVGEAARARARWADGYQVQRVRNGRWSWSSSKIRGQEALQRESRRQAIQGQGEPFTVKTIISRMGPCGTCVRARARARACV